MAAGVYGFHIFEKHPNVGGNCCVFNEILCNSMFVGETSKFYTDNGFVMEVNNENIVVMGARMGNWNIEWN
jgi:hypothetical protein